MQPELETVRGGGCCTVRKRRLLQWRWKRRQLATDEWVESRKVGGLCRQRLSGMRTERGVGNASGEAARGSVAHRDRRTSAGPMRTQANRH